MKFIYSVQDSVAEVWTDPACYASDEISKRDLKNVVNTPGTIYYNNPADFALYRIGRFDEQEGIVYEDTPELVISCYALKEEGENN